MVSKKQEFGNLLNSKKKELSNKKSVTFNKEEFMGLFKLIGQLATALTFPGVMVHEWMHYRMCRYLDVEVYEVCYWQPGNPSGFVRHAPLKNRQHRLWIGLAPLAGGLFLGLLIGVLGGFFAFQVLHTPLSPIGEYLKLNRPLLVFAWGIYWIGFSILVHAIPSSSDLSFTELEDSFWLRSLQAILQLVQSFYRFLSFFWLDWILMGMLIVIPTHYLIVYFHPLMDTLHYHQDCGKFISLNPKSYCDWNSDGAQQGGFRDLNADYSKDRTQKTGILKGTPVLQWTFKEKLPGLRMAVEDNRLIVKSRKKIQVLELDTSDEIWEYAPEDPLDSFNDENLTLADGKAFVGLRDKGIVVLDLNQGQLIHQYVSQKGVLTQPVVQGAFLVYGEFGGSIHAWNREKNNLLWTRSMDGFLKTPAIFEKRVALATSQGKISLVDLTTGKEFWEVQMESQIYSSPMVSSGLLILIGASQVWALNTQNGQIVWTLTGERFGENTQPAVAYQDLFLVTANKKLLKIEIKTGKIEWKKQSLLLLEATPVLTYPYVWGLSEGIVMSIDYHNGQLTGQWSTDSQLGLQQVLIHKPYLITGSHDAGVQAFFLTYH